MIIEDFATLHNDDCLAVLDTIQENSVDTIITDPPYEIGFMSKEWDSTGIAFQPETWKKVFRIAKPGAILMAFGGTRTYHRLACAIEDAGWELKDCIMYMYATGFPKGINLSKAIDRAAGAERKVVGKRIHPTLKNEPKVKSRAYHAETLSSDQSKESWDITEPSTEEAKIWDGWNTTLKPSWEPIIVAMKPCDGTFTNNALVHHVAGFNIDGSRISYQNEQDKSSATPQGKCTSKKGFIGAEPDAGRDLERIEYERSELKGRWPANMILCHHPECVQDGTKKVKGTKPHPVYSKNPEYDGWGNITNKNGEIVNKYEDADGFETVESWNCHPDCPVRILDQQSGNLKSGDNCFINKAGDEDYENNVYGKYSKKKGQKQITYGDSGGASRFFKTLSYNSKTYKIEECDVDLEPNSIFYVSKASSKERNLGLDKDQKNIHPTVKPLRLLEYLCRLTATPFGGTVCDPFMGSGTTGMACSIVGRNFIGIERDEHSYATACKRIEYAHEECKKIRNQKKKKKLFE